MKPNLLKTVCAFLLFCGMWLAIQPAPALGHNGGEPRLVDVQAGDFRLSVWTLPVPLVTGEQNFIVFVAESAEDDENAFVRANTPVLDADIQLVIKPAAGGDSLLVAPDHERATNKLFYESYFVLEDPGAYTAVVSVAADDKTGEAEFAFDVAQGILEINWLRYSGFAVMAVAVGWFVWQVRQDRLLGGEA